MDALSAVVLGNCTIAVGCLVARSAIVGFRRQLVAVSDYCDRWWADCDRVFVDTPESLATCLATIRQLRLGYAQHSARVERLQTVGLAIGLARSLFGNSLLKSLIVRRFPALPKKL